MSENTLKHIEHLASTIGARGSTTPKEKEAHEYCKQTLEGLGYETHWEEFYSPVSGLMPYHRPVVDHIRRADLLRHRANAKLFHGRDCRVGHRAVHRPFVFSGNDPP